MPTYPEEVLRDDYKVGLEQLESVHEGSITLIDLLFNNQLIYAESLFLHP